MTDTTSGAQLPQGLHRYLSDASLTALWKSLRARLQSKGLVASGRMKVLLDDNGAERLAGLLGTPIRPGALNLDLADLDAALRRSSAAAGLVTVTEILTGTPLVDQKAEKATHDDAWAQVWAVLDERLAQGGLADAAWVPEFIQGLRRAGTLTRAGIPAATTAVDHATTTLAELAPDGPLAPPHTTPVIARWELAELAGRCTGDAHGLDDGRLTTTLVLRATATALHEPVPDTAAARRALWARIGVTSDQLSGTVLVSNLTPQGPHPWAAMMRERTNMGLITHLTLHELRGPAASIPLTIPGELVYACENPQVLQAASRAGSTTPLVCFAGNPASAGWLLLQRLQEAGAQVLYHGDYDWPGMTIAGRLITAGATPWRLTATDYDHALTTLGNGAQLELSGTAVRTDWDQDLAVRMHQAGTAVHEESILPTLLTDLVG